MRKRLCCLLFVIASCVTQATGQDQQGRREAGVRAVITKFADARNTHDLQALIALYTDDAEWIPARGVFVRGRPALLEMWSRQVKSVAHVDRTISQIDLLAPNIAVVHVSDQYPPPIGAHEEVFIVVNEYENWKIHIHQAIK
jgi:uncharacterized protein (TIGR02246 family)